MYVEGEAPLISGGNNGGFFGNEGLWAVIILAIIFGWGRNGFGPNNGGNGDLSGALTRGDLCQDMNFNDLQNGVRNVSDAVNLGFSNLNSTICHQQYDTAMLLNNLGNNLQTNLNAMNISNLQSTNAIQNQMASCCCNIERGLDRVVCEGATNTAAIIQAGNTNTQRILDYLCNEKIESQRAKITALQNTIDYQNLGQYIVNQVRPFPQASYVVPNPYTGNCGYNNSCAGCSTFA